MTIETEIRDAVSKHLPQALGEELQRRLKQADEDAAKLATAKQELEAVRAFNSKLTADIKELQAQLKVAGELSARETAVALRERAADLFELRAQLEAAKSNQQFAKDVALGLVRNVEYRHSVHETATSRAVGVPQGGMLQTTYQPETVSRSTAQQAV